LQPQRDPRGAQDQGEGGRVLLRAARLPRAGEPEGDAVLRRPGREAARLLHRRRRRHPEAARGRPGRRAEVGGLLDPQDRERPDRLPVRGLQGHLHLRPLPGPEGLHHLPLQSRRLPGRAGEGEGPGEHHLPLRARGRQRGRAQGQRGSRVRRRDPHRGQPLRRAEGRLLRQVLTPTPATTHTRIPAKDVPMAIRIDKKITGYAVATPEDKAKAAEQPAPAPAASEERGAKVIQMHEKIERPETLVGSTYKLKTPLFEHALYVTINDIVLNAGSEHEHRRPFEIFINSKNMDHFQWIVALTRIMSAVFRKGGDVTFLVEEMK